MTTRGGFTLNGIHFNQTDSTRAGRPQTFFFLDGKRVSREAYAECLANAKAAEAASATRYVHPSEKAEAEEAAHADIEARLAPAPAAAPATSPAPTGGLRGAVKAAVEAWRAGQTIGTGLEAHLATLEAFLVFPSSAPATRQPKADSKQATVIGMLQSPGGASNPDIQNATDWQPHTVRGFLAGLKHKGYRIDGAREEGRGMVYRIGGEA